MLTRLQGIGQTHAESRVSSRLLTIDEDGALIQLINHYAETGFPLRLQSLRAVVTIVRDTRVPAPPPHQVGKNWVRRFLKRHPEVVTTFPRHLDQDRRFNTDPEVAEKWFELVDHTVRKYGIPTGNMFNMDEKGFMLGVAGKIYKVSHFSPLTDLAVGRRCPNLGLFTTQICHFDAVGQLCNEES